MKLKYANYTPGFAALIAALLFACNVQAGESHGHGHGHGAKAEGAGSPGGMSGNMPTFSDFDADGDGGISQAEFNQLHSERMSKMAAEGRKMKHAGDMPGFAGIDSDGDGVISPAELESHQSSHHQKHHGEKHHGKKHHEKTE